MTVCADNYVAFGIPDPNVFMAAAATAAALSSQRRLKWSRRSSSTIFTDRSDDRPSTTMTS